MFFAVVVSSVAVVVSSTFVVVSSFELSFEDSFFVLFEELFELLFVLVFEQLFVLLHYELLFVVAFFVLEKPELLEELLPDELFDEELLLKLLDEFDLLLSDLLFLNT